MLEGRVSDDFEKARNISAEIGTSKFVKEVERRSITVEDTRSDSNFQGFICDLCGRVYTDNASYLDHLNSKAHLASLGLSLEVKKSTVEEVRDRLTFHIEKRLRQLEGFDELHNLKTYNFDREVEKLQHEEELRKEKYFFMRSCFIFFRNKLTRQEKKQKKLNYQIDEEDIEGNEEMRKVLGFTSFK